MDDHETEQPGPAQGHPGSPAPGIPVAPPVHAGSTGRPRTRSIGAVVTGVVLSVVSVAGVAFLVLSVVGFLQYANHDRIELLDLPDTADAAALACTELTGVLADPVPDRAEQIARGDAAIARLTARMTALGDDVLDDDLPARDWIADWEAVAAAREEVRASVVAGAPATFHVPQTEDGYDVTQRMASVGPEECARAVELATRP